MGVEGAAFVGDQHDALQLVGLDQEPEVTQHHFCIPIRGEVICETGRAPGHSQSVVPRQGQTLLEQVIHLLSEPSVAAVDCDSVHPVIDKRD